MNKSKFIIISDTQAIIQINDPRITPQKAKAMSEAATKSFKDGKSIILSPDFEIEDRRNINCPCSNCEPISVKDVYSG